MSVEKRNGYWCFRRKILDPVTNELKHTRIGKYKTKKEAQIVETKFLGNMSINKINTKMLKNWQLNRYDNLNSPVPGVYLYS